MRFGNLFAVLAVAAVGLIAVTGCFTGIESTPKITGDNLRENGVKVTDEQIFASSIVAQAPKSWQTGKKWLVTDPKIALAFTPASASTDSIIGKELSLVDSRPVRTVTGDEVVELVLRSDDGRSFFHRTTVPYADWNDRPSYSIPFTIELSSVALADSLMRGKMLYINTPRWYDSEGRDIVGQRHIPVNIVAVRPGNHLYPLLVAFTQPNRPNEPVRYILMTYGPETSSNRNFDRIFSFVNPRKLYPQISDENWEFIINSRIKEGMTRDECRLALGTPASVDRGSTPGAQLERWSYENGVYLLFEDGILTKFRL